jgi:hypothetical protein
MADDPRDIYYFCLGCGRKSISFDKPFPTHCAECRVVEILNARTGYQARPHRWAYCDWCRTRMVICGKCGNNCCNGGFGELWPGIVCDACPAAYDMQNQGEP